MNIGIYFNEILKKVNNISLIKFIVYEEYERREVSYSKDMRVEDFIKDYLKKYINYNVVDTSLYKFLTGAKILNNPKYKNYLLKDVIRENGVVRFMH